MALWQGLILVSPQSSSAVQLPAPPTGQHSPLPQQIVPGMQETMKNVQNPSLHAAPVQASASPSWQSASWVQVICAALVCAAHEAGGDQAQRAPTVSRGSPAPCHAIERVSVHDDSPSRSPIVAVSNA